MNLRPTSISLAFFILLWITPIQLSGCEESRPRCAQCGMFVDLAPRWRAGALNEAGSEVSFDSPKCLLRWLASERGRGAQGPWVTEYYGQRHAEVSSVWWVIGSDVEGPMGRDLVPLDSEQAAQRFLTEHHGAKVLRRDDIRADVLRDLH